MVQAQVTRREFLKASALVAAQVTCGAWLTGCANALAASAPPPAASDAPAPIATPTLSRELPFSGWREVKYYDQLASAVVQCAQCPRRCVIAPNARGFCQTRENRDGKLYSVVYGRPCITKTTPIEKAAIYHMLPGTQSYSLGTAGCNLACLYCQNYTIARAKPEEVESYTMTPDDVVAAALKAKTKSITFSYSEASVAFEWMMDIAKVARAKGLKVILKTGGYINEAPLKELCGALDAINVDMKGFSQTFYDQVCQGELKYVLETIKTIRRENKAWLEVANLVVPGYNDDPKMIGDFCAWFKENLGDDVPVFFTRYEPAYRLRMPPTPVETMERTYKIARDAGLKYAYVGNLPGHTGANTYCPKCGKLLIERVGFDIKQNQIAKGKCKFCGETINGKWA